MSSGPAALLLGYASLPERQIELGISQLAAVIKEGQSSPSKSTFRRPTVWDPIESALKARIAETTLRTRKSRSGFLRTVARFKTSN